MTRTISFPDTDRSHYWRCRFEHVEKLPQAQREDDELYE